MKIILLLLLITFFGGCVSKQLYTPPSTVQGLQKEQAQLNRVWMITRKILVANTPICTQTRADYGFRALLLTEHGDKEQKELWTKAFDLQHQQPTIISIIPESSADKVGLRIGDVIISVNGTKWVDTTSRNEFGALLKDAQKLEKMQLGIRRGKHETTLTLIAERMCDYSFMLNISKEHKAMAQERKIIVDSGAVELLKRDDELAFFISHELAHILLGHTLPERKKEIVDYKMRSVVEKDADALGIRMMVRAGYDPKGAETALQSTDLIDSGPVTNFFNFHGPYMPVPERINFLRKILNK